MRIGRSERFERARPFVALGIAFVGFGTWGHHMFVAGISLFDAGADGILTMLVAIFSAIKVFTWVLDRSAVIGGLQAECPRPALTE